MTTPRACGRLDRHEARRGERGQVIVLLVLFLVVLLGMSAMVIDVGYAYYAHRSLQASADAAALAGAQELPTRHARRRSRASTAPQRVARTSARTFPA